jgi:hypothetical protein
MYRSLQLPKWTKHTSMMKITDKTKFFLYLVNKNAHFEIRLFKYCILFWNDTIMISRVQCLSTLYKYDGKIVTWTLSVLLYIIGYMYCNIKICYFSWMYNQYGQININSCRSSSCKKHSISWKNLQKDTAFLLYNCYLKLYKKIIFPENRTNFGTLIENWSPRNNWNIVESGLKHHNSNP